MGNLIAEVRKLNSIFAKLESKVSDFKEQYHCFVRKVCAYGKVMLGQCSILTEIMRQNCRVTFISSS